MASRVMECSNGQTPVVILRYLDTWATYSVVLRRSYSQPEDSTGLPLTTVVPNGGTVVIVVYACSIHTYPRASDLYGDAARRITIRCDLAEQLSIPSMVLPMAKVLKLASVENTRSCC